MESESTLRQYEFSDELEIAAAISENRKNFINNGYVVIRNGICKNQIDQLLALYQEQILPTTTRFYRQNTFKYERNKINEYGFCTSSLLDIHNYRLFPQFSQAALDIFCDNDLHAKINEVNGYSSHNLMQTMMFDANTETWPHQDWWYLDSRPKAGQLIGVWFALEDIQKPAGRFYVLPGSQKEEFHKEYPGIAHNDWIKKVGEFVKTSGTKVAAPALNKGDILIWSSGTVHGSEPNIDPRYSRKSLTAHYLPSEMTFGNLFIEKPWIEYREYQGKKFYANQPEYSVKNHVLSEAKRYLYGKPKLMAFARKFQSKSFYS